MFDERHFPYGYECEACGREATVAHEDVQDVPSYLATSSVNEAAEYVMTNRRGWVLQATGGAFCPDCDPPSPLK